MIVIYFIFASLLGAGATGAYGWYKGYTQCNQTAEIVELKRQIEQNKNTQQALEAQNFTKEQLNEENQKLLQENELVINALQNQIISMPKSNDGIIGADFLRNVNKIR